MAGPFDLILSRGKVITVDPNFSLAEAVAVQGERIVAVGGGAVGRGGIAVDHREGASGARGRRRGGRRALVYP